MKNYLSLLCLLLTILLATPAVMADDDEEFEELSGPRAEVAPGLGLNPGKLTIKTYGMAAATESADDLGQTKQNKFYFTGFLRAPFNVGFGTAQNLAEGQDNVDVAPDKTRLHAPPHIPDTSYLDWRYTNNHGGPWTEIQFTYGNETVSANVSMATYNLTDGGYRQLHAQLGIDKAFVNMNFPGLFGDVGGMVVNVGVFSNKYGAAGRYAADMYDTYLVGYTHTAGENVRFYFDVAPKITLHFEQGFGGKVEAYPLISYNLQDVTGADVTNGPENANVVNPVVQPFLPYGGTYQQGTTLLHHEHIGLSYDDKLFFGGHLMHSFTADARNDDISIDIDNDGTGDDGHIWSASFDIKMIDFFFGNGYLGYSHLDMKNPDRVGGAFESVHSVDGWSYRQNYLKGSYAGGTVDTVLFQYEFSLAKFLWHPEEYWGQDRDLKLKLFGMLNFITPDQPETFDAASTKFKWGADALYVPLKWLGVGLRWDTVNPDMDDVSQTSNQLSGRVVLRTDFVSQEEITIQYTQYFNNENVTTGYPWNEEGKELTPDFGVLTIAASMWW